MFIPKKTEDGRIPPIVHLPAGAIVPEIGLCLYMSGGKLAVAGGANVAQYVCMTESEVAVASGTEIPVIRILPDIVFETTKDAATAMTVGTAYDVATGGRQVDADGKTTANFLVEQIDGQAAGATVYGRFIK